MTVKPIATGTLAGLIAYHVTLTENTDVGVVADDILSTPTAVSRIVVLTERGLQHDEVRVLMSELHKHKCQIVWQPESERPDALWYMADHVRLLTTVKRYMGTPAHEVHLYWEPSYGDYQPVVAPLGAQQTYIYVYTSKEFESQLISWARDSVTPMRIITGVM